MKKQLLSILLCLIMVVGLLPTAALAEEAAPVFNLATDLAGIEYSKQSGHLHLHNDQ